MVWLATGSLAGQTLSLASETMRREVSIWEGVAEKLSRIHKVVCVCMCVCVKQPSKDLVLGTCLPLSGKFLVLHFVNSETCVTIYDAVCNIN